MNVEWGSHYEPTAKDVENKIKELQAENRFT